MNDEATFTEAVETWIGSLAENAPEALLFIVGTKSELDQRVPEERAKKLALELNARFWETSAKGSVNTQKLFAEIEEAVGEVLTKQAQEVVPIAIPGNTDGNTREKQECC
jgi:GTPase SAR1 family protein